jgi:predicted TIM-barrel fold metal-dependent hydrolase
MTTHEAATYEGPIFDADTHLHEKDFHFFKEYLPKQYHADWLPARKHGPDGRHGLYVGDRLVENFEFPEDGRVPSPGKLKEWLRAVKAGLPPETGYIDPLPCMMERDARIAKLDEFGVEACLLFMGEFTSTFGYFDENAAGHAVMHAYNEWLHEHWGFAYRTRIHAVGLLPLWDTKLALEEADWLIARGVRAVVMPMGPAQGKSLAHPDFDPVWSRLNEAEVLVTFHVTEAKFMHSMIREWGEKPLQSRRMGQTAWQWMFCYSELPVQITLANIIFHNFFERFPKIRIASVENGAAWLPHFLDKMDKMRGMAKNGYWPCGQLKDRPSRIFKEHCFVVAYPEDPVTKLIEEVGASCLLMGSDYPHAEGVETPRKFVSVAMPDAAAADIKVIMYDNGRRMLPTAA